MEKPSAETIRCPFCLAEIPAGAKKCRYCREWLVPTKQCPYCLAWVPENAKKCMHCGEWLEKPLATRPSDVSTPSWEYQSGAGVGTPQPSYPSQSGASAPQLATDPTTRFLQSESRRSDFKWQSSEDTPPPPTQNVHIYQEESSTFAVITLLLYLIGGFLGMFFLPIGVLYLIAGILNLVGLFLGPRKGCFLAMFVFFILLPGLLLLLGGVAIFGFVNEIINSF
ncbi:MAG TPA: hypothetical protein ENK60_06510 [Anaerolineae bacterium]|nr:hypothetical protein [Anaerolineae bacterium]